MTFAGRLGIKKEKPLLKDDISNELKNRLTNLLRRELERILDIDLLYCYELLNYILNDLGKLCLNAPNNSRSGIGIIIDFVTNGEWYVVYDVIEIFLNGYEETTNGSVRNIIDYETLIPEINKILSQENSGYRLDDYDAKFVAIPDEQELLEINKAKMNKNPYDPVRKHIDKALTHLSRKKDPDFENSVKESISAVESLCCILTNNKKETLGGALKKLKENNIYIHPALAGAFNKLYGYTSDNDGTRHGSIDFKDCPYEDARFMLVACSAFINYVLAKKI